MKQIVLKTYLNKLKEKYCGLLWKIDQTFLFKISPNK